MKSVTFAIDSRAIKACAHAVEANEFRPYLQGVCVEYTPTGPLFVGTNGSHLIVTRHDWKTAAPPEPFEPVIVPAKLLKRTRASVYDSRKPTTMTLSWREDDEPAIVTISRDRNVEVAFAIKGAYPTWRTALPKDPPSGEPATYNTDLLKNFREAIKTLQGPHTTTQPLITPNGIASPTLVDLCAPEWEIQAFGVIMPYRHYKKPTLTSVPDWAL